MNATLHSFLSSIHQEALIDCLDETQQKNLLNDLQEFNNYYPGGIQSYINNAISLLDGSIGDQNQISGIDVDILCCFSFRFLLERISISTVTSFSQ